MKHILTAIVTCLLLASLSGCSLWAFGDNDAIGIRSGVKVSETIEVGASTNYWPDNDNDSQTYGAYAITHGPLGTYAGAQTNLSNDYDEQIAPIVGFIYDDIFFVEYQYRNWENKASQEDHKVMFGIRIPLGD